MQNPYLYVMQDCVRDIKARYILETYGISSSLIDYLNFFNNSSDAPYHGHQHALTVMINSYNGAKIHNLCFNETKLLLIAALFHDFNHLSGKAASDAENICLAVEGFKTHNDFFTCLTESEIKRVEKLIKSTTFPHTNPKDLTESLLQDSDMLQTLEPDGSRFLEGLSIESGQSRSVECNDAFLNNFHFNTPWACKLIHVEDNCACVKV